MRWTVNDELTSDLYERNLHETCAAGDEDVLYLVVWWELGCAFEDRGAVDDGSTWRVSFLLL